MTRSRLLLGALAAILSAAQAVPALGATIDLDSSPADSIADRGQAATSEEWQASVPGLYPVGEVATGLPLQPRSLTLDPTTGFMWVSSRSEDTVTVYDHGGDEELTFGVSGTGSGQLDQPQGIAIAGGEVFVAEEGNDRVQVFDRSGNHLRMWGSQGAGAGQLSEPCDVEVVGNFVYVTDTANSRIQVFTKAGNYVNQFGSAGSGDGQLSLGCSGSYLTHYNGEIFVSDSFNGRVAVFSLDGTWERNFGSGVVGNMSYGIDADDTGQIWVADAADSVTVWSPVGGLIGDFGGTGAGIGTFSTLVALAADPKGRTAWTVEVGTQRIQAFTTVSCDGELLTHVGTSYPDEFTTGPGDDVVHLGGGGDTVETKSGSDTVCGGRGADLIRAGYGKDKVLGEKGDDTIFGGKGGDVLIGAGGDDTFNGGRGADTIRGKSGNDTAKGGDGDDTLVGGSKGDVLKGNDGDDTLRGGSGNDICRGGKGSDTAKGCETQTGIDLLSGRVPAVLPQEVKAG